MWNDFKSFMARPYQQDMSAADWFLFIGLILVILVLWGVILRHIREAM